MVKVAVGIILSDHKVLVCQRKKSSRYPLKWEFPGGKMEPGESIEDCLRRELREELSIDATIGAELHKQSWVYPDAGAFEVLYHLVPSFSGNLQNNVFEQVQWVELKNLRTVDMLEGNRETVDLLMRSHPNF